MKPLNKKERSKAFINFIWMFLFTSLLIVGAVYFDFRVPLKENKVLKKDNTKLRKEYDFQMQFIGGVKDVKINLDSINMEGQNVFFLEQLVSRKLATMKEAIPSDGIAEQKAYYDYVIQLCLELQTAKRELRDLQGMKTMINDYKENLQRYKDEFNQAKRDLDICRQLSNVNR